MTPSAETIPLLVTLGYPGDNSFNLRFPPEYSEEILSLLDNHGLDHNTALEMSAGPEEWIEVVKVLGVGAGGTGGLAGLAAVIKAFVHRHDGKRFVLKRGGSEIEAAGYSEKEQSSSSRKCKRNKLSRTPRRAVAGRLKRMTDLGQGKVLLKGTGLWNIGKGSLRDHVTHFFLAPETFPEQPLAMKEVLL